MKTLKSLALASFFALPSISYAEIDLGVGLKVGTQGLGLELTYPLTETLNIRGGYYYFEFDEDLDDTDVTYDAELDLTNVSLLFDWHVFNGGFRLTAGLVSYSEGSFNGTAKPAAGATYTFNGVTYSASDVTDVKASVEFGSTAPYIGFGWGDAVGSGNWAFMLDIGLINLDGADVAVDYQCNVGPAVCDPLGADIQAEIDELEDDANDLEWWPVINLGIAYKF